MVGLVNRRTLNPQLLIPMNTMNTITLWLNSRGEWMATHSGPCAARLLELFGTTTLPTPYRAPADPEDVRDIIRQRNPSCSVQIALD